MGIENRKSTELDDLFASIVDLDSDNDKNKKEEKTSEGMSCDFTTGVCMPADQASSQETNKTNNTFQTIDLSQLDQ